MSGQKVGVTKSFGVLLLLAAVLSIDPGSFVKASEADAAQILKIAMPVPRAQEIAVQVAEYNAKLAALTNNAIQVRIYWGGAAGDDNDVLRKIKTGQMDAAPFSLELVSSFVRQAMVLGSPALFRNYKQLYAVRDALSPEFDKEAYENGFKVMGWGDVGRLRLMSKQPVSSLADFRKARPWLYPQSAMLKDFYKTVGANGIPLGIIEVYGALQTNMIDVVWISAVLGAALQWHTATHYITADSLGFISGAFVIRRGAWDAIPESAKVSMLDLAKEIKGKQEEQIPRQDKAAYKRLTERGHTAVKLANVPEWEKVGHDVREHMVGRIYTRDLLSRAEEIASKFQGIEN